MSFTLTVWVPPANTPAPLSLAEADAQLAQQHRQPPPPAPNPRLQAFGRALYERFAPSSDADLSNDVWSDGSEDGEFPCWALNFGLLTDSRCFDAAYLHAIAQARSLGLHLSDPQGGEHFLADGRTLVPGQPDRPARPVEDDLWEAEASWRRLDWSAARSEWRQAATDGDPVALHELGRCLLEGRDRTPSRLAGAALMVLADLDHPAFRQARDRAVAALHPVLQARLPALLADWRQHADLAEALEAQLQADDARRAASGAWPASFREMSPAQQAEALELAADGDPLWASTLADLAQTDPATAQAACGWTPANAPAEARRWRLAAADAPHAVRYQQVAEALLRGDPGWSLDPMGALVWLRRASLYDPRADLAEVIANLLVRRPTAWDPVAHRARAHALLASLRPETPDAERLAKLRRACELDHPAAWRQLGQAYQTGALGLAQDIPVGNALIMQAHKALAATGRSLPLAIMKEMKYGQDYDATTALRLNRRLTAAADPWRLIADDQRRRAAPPPTEPPAPPPTAASGGGGHAPAANGDAARPAGGAVSRQAMAPTPRSRAHRGRQADAAPAPTPGFAGSLAMLWAGSAGTVLWMGSHGGLGKGLARLVVFALCALAASGAWRCAGGLGRGLGGRLVAAAAAGFPMLGLLQAGELTRAVWQQRLSRH